MDMQLSDAMASARGLAAQDRETVRDLVDVWRRHYPRNRLRDAYYYGHVPVKDLGVSVSPEMARKLRPHVDWAAKCVDWWADRVQFDGITAGDDGAQAALEAAFSANDARNLLHKAVTAALRHSCSFLAVNAAEDGSTVLSAYPATAAAALWDDSLKSIESGLVVVESARVRGTDRREPKTVHVLTPENLIVLERGAFRWHAAYVPHGMGRAPMEPIAYHPTLERPFGRSRITRTVMSLVDDAQREMMNMAVAAAFSAAPQKYLLNTDSGTARKIAETKFGAFIGSIFTATRGKDGQAPQFGQLAQLSMQPHSDYMRMLAAQFSGTTGVPLSSLGVVSDNPSSAEAIYASKEDAVVDIQSFVDGCKRSVADVALMVLAARDGLSFREEAARGPSVDVHFRKPDRPSVVSQSDAMVKQISAIPWLADSDVALRELGYDDEQVHQLRSDRARSRSQGLVMQARAAADAQMRQGGAE